jgi:hypothetical protein
MAKARAGKSKRETHGHPDPELSKADIKSLEEEWLASRVKGDIEFSDRLIDDGYQGTTSQGLVQSKANFIHEISRSAASHSVAHCLENETRVYGEIAISTGLITMQDLERTHSFRYLRIFRNTGGHWRLIASQSTRTANAV